MRLFELQSLRLVPRLPETPEPPQNPGTQVQTGAVSTKQVPIQTFGGDVPIGASSDVTIDATLQFSDRCTGFLLVSVVGTVLIAVNGSALRTVASDEAFNDAYIRQVRVVTGVASSVILQLHGE